MSSAFFAVLKGRQALSVHHHVGRKASRFRGPCESSTPALRWPIPWESIFRFAVRITSPESFPSRRSRSRPYSSQMLVAAACDTVLLFRGVIGGQTPSGMGLPTSEAPSKMPNLPEFCANKGASQVEALKMQTVTLLPILLFDPDETVPKNPNPCIVLSCAQRDSKRKSQNPIANCSQTVVGVRLGSFTCQGICAVSCWPAPSRSTTLK